MAMTLNDWFEKGMTYEAYVDAMNVHRDELLAIYEKVELTKEERAFFEQGREKEWRVIVLTADWCGDAMLCVPIFRRIAEAAGFDARFLIRDENLELMDQYLTNGKSRSIPIFIFIDKDGNERAVWGPRAPEVQKMVEEARSQLPDKDNPEFEAKQKAMFRAFREKFTTDPTIWEAVKRSMRERLAEAWEG
jgi:hypothetical protein